MLAKFYYDVAAKHVPQGSDLDNLKEGKPYVGCAAVDTEWLCWYRFAYGDHDVQHRPGRVVLFAAFCRRSDAKNIDGSRVLESQVIMECVRTAPSQRPPDRPTSLELVCQCGGVKSPPEELGRLEERGRLTIGGDRVREKVGEIVASLERNRTFDFFCHPETADLRLERVDAAANLYAPLEPLAREYPASPPKPDEPEWRRGQARKISTEQSEITAREGASTPARAAAGTAQEEPWARDSQFSARVFFSGVLLGLLLGLIVAGIAVWCLVGQHRSGVSRGVAPPTGRPRYHVYSSYSHPPAPHSRLRPESIGPNENKAANMEK